MTDIAELALKVDARDVKKANDELGRMSGASKKVERDVDKFASTANTKFAAIGRNLGIVAAGFVSLSTARSLVDATIQIQKFNNALVVATGSNQAAAKEMAFVRAEADRLGLNLRTSAEQYSKLAAAAKGTALQGQATRDIFTAVSQAATVLGLSADEAGGALTAIQQIISKGTVSAEELRGQLGERLPGAFQIAARSIGVTTQELDKLLRTGSITAEQLLPELARELNKTFGSQSVEAAQNLNAQINRFDTALFDLKVAVGETGVVDFFSDAIKTATALSEVVTLRVIPSIQNLANVLGIATSDKSDEESYGGVIWFLNQISGKSKIASQNAKQLADGISKIDVSQTINPDSTPSTRLSERLKQEADARKENERILKQNIQAGNEYIQSLKQQASEIGKTESELRELKAAQLGVLDAAKPYLKTIEEQLKKEKQLSDQRDKQADDLRRIEEITESVKTKQEVYNDTVKELDDLLTKGLGIEEYNRALQQAEDRLTGLTEATRQSTGQFSQFWIQAVRSVQDALADAIFSIKDGFDGLVSGIGRALGRIASQFAALKISDAIGLSALFGIPGTAAASTGSSIGAFDIASLGSSALNLFNTGFGATGLVGSGISSIGSSLGLSSVANFGAGLAGTSASAGVFGAGGAGFLSGGSQAAIAAGSEFGAAALGASLSAFAGPAVIAAAVDFGLRQLFGDKKLGGAAGDILGFVPIIGTLINGLFGRGAPKFRREELLGSVGAGGFEGVFNTQFREKGGAFRSSRFSNFILDTDSGQLLNSFGRLSESGNFPKGLSDQILDPATKRALEIGNFLDESFTAIADSAKNAAEQLGISTKSLDSFSAEIDLVSEKGETLSQEQIADEIGRISDEMVRTLIPSIDLLSRSGETASQALSRIGSEFSALERTLRIMGETTNEARSFLQGFSIEQRTQFVELAGGTQLLNQQVDFFFNNILSDADRLRIKSEELSTSLAEFGVDFIPTVEQLKEFVVNGAPTLRELSASLSFAPLIAEVNQLKEANAGGLGGNIPAQTAFENLKRSVDAERNRLTKEYNDDLREQNGIIQSIAGSINDLESLSRTLNQSVEQLNPLSVGGARSQIQNAINSARAGVFPDVAEISQALQTLTSESTDRFTNRADFLLSKAQSSALISELGSLVGGELTDQQRLLSEAERTRDELEAGFNKEIEKLDNILGNAQKQVDILTGIDSTLLSIDAALAAFNQATGGSAPNAPGSASTGLIGVNRRTIIQTDQERSLIRDFFSKNPSEELIIEKAKEFGVRFGQIAQALDFGVKQQNEFLTENPLVKDFFNVPIIPRSFDVGSSFVQKTGPAIVHRGERIINSSQNQDLVNQLKQLVAEVAESGKSSKRLYDFLNPMTDDGLALKVKTT